MKRIFQFLLIVAALFAVLSASGQRINPTTQIKAAAGADTILISRANGDFVYKDASYLNSIIQTVQQGSGAPSGAPGAGQSWLYVNTSNGNVYYWSGSAWIGPFNTNHVNQGSGAPSGAPGAGQSSLYVNTSNGHLYVWNGSTWIDLYNLAANYPNYLFTNGLTKTDTTVRFGGSLTQNTDINGKALYRMYWDSLTEFRARARNGGASTAHSLFQVSNTNATGVNATSFVPSNLSQFGQIQVRPTVSSYLRQSAATVRGAVIVTDHSAELVYSTLSGETVTDQNRVIVDSTGTYLTVLPEKTTDATKLLWYNPSTEEVYEGYSSELVRFDSLASGIFVQYAGTGITASRTSGSATITVPATAKILSARVTGADANNDGSGNFSVTFSGAGITGNTSVATLRIPATQKVDLSAQGSGAPSTSNPYPFDDDDTVQCQVVGVGSPGSPSITIRTVGLTAAYNNYQLVFNW